MDDLAVRSEDRRAYLDALEQAALTADLAPFQRLLHERLDATLAAYLSTVIEAVPGET